MTAPLKRKDYYCRLRCLKPYQVGTGHEFRPGDINEAPTKKAAEDMVRSGFFEVYNPQLQRETEENIKLLSLGDIRRYNLNQGTFNNLWYFGKAIKGKCDICDSIVLSDRRFLVDKTERIRGVVIGENEIAKIGLDYQGSLEETKSFWSNQSIESWLMGKYESQDKRQVFQEIRGRFDRYMELQDPAEYDVMSCFTLGTYCYELFESYPILHLTGLKESGKSKGMKVSRLMSFHGEEASGISEAAVYRSIEAMKGTLCIDEHEKDEDTERKKLIDTLLRAGIEKGASVLRMEKISNKYCLRRFDVFCPKIVCNISGLRDTTASRCITIRLLKTNTPKGNIKPRENGSEWQEIRDSCYVLMVENWEDIQDAYENHNSGKIQNRKEDIWKPILSIAKFISDDVYQSVEDYALRSIEENVVDLFDDDWDFQLLSLLQEKINQEAYYPTGDITLWLADRLEIPNPPRNAWVGRRLKAHGFQSRRVGKGTEYRLSPEIVADRFQRRYGELKEPETKEVYTLPTLHTLPTQHTQPTVKTGVGSEGSVRSVAPQGLLCSEKRRISEALKVEFSEPKPQGRVIELAGEKGFDLLLTGTVCEEMLTKGELQHVKDGMIQYVGGGAP